MKHVVLETNCAGLSEIHHDLGCGILNIQVQNVSHKTSKQMVCCYRQLFEFTKRSQYYKNNSGIAIGRPYNPGRRMRFLGLKNLAKKKKKTFVHIKLVSKFENSRI